MIRRPQSGKSWGGGSIPCLALTFSNPHVAGSARFCSELFQFRIWFAGVCLTHGTGRWAFRCRSHSVCVG
jgi:hypothetical protein